MAWYLAPSLKQFRDEINAVHPNRSKVSDGTVGDTSHSARKSDHNPDYADGGVVRAMDITNDGVNVDAVIICAISDWRVAYVISRGLIYARDNGFRPVKYTGSNSHSHHIHISGRHGKTYENSTLSWEYAKRAGVLPPPPPPVQIAKPPAVIIPEEEEDMLLFRNEENGAVVLMSGGKVFSIEGATLTKNDKLTNFSSIMGAGVKSANVTASQFARILKQAG